MFTAFTGGSVAVKAAELAELTIERHNGVLNRFSPGLVEPMRIRAEALYRRGDYAAALAGFAQAQWLLRMHEGLHVVGQLPLIYRQADAASALGDIVSANDLEEAAFETAMRSYESESSLLLPVLMRLAGWYLQAGYVSAARALYENALDLSELHRPETNSDYARALEGIAKTYVEEAFPNFDRHTDAYYSQITPSSLKTERLVAGMKPLVDVGEAVAFGEFRAGQQALRRLVEFRRELFENDSSGLRAKDLIDALLAFGDWHVRFRNSREALTAFGQARALMSPLQAQREFGTPKLLFMPNLGDPDNVEHSRGSGLLLDGLDRPGKKEGEVRFLLRINRHGMVTRVTKLSSSPEDLADFRYKRESRRARYRPALEDGEFAAAGEVEAVHRFAYASATAVTGSNPRSNPEPN